MSALRFKVAWPCLALQSNGRPSTYSKNNATQRAKMETWAEAVNAGAQRVRLRVKNVEERIPVRITFHEPDDKGVGKRDDHNMPYSVKAHIDGLALAIGVNDRRFKVEWVHAEPSGRGYVVIEVMP